MKKHVKKYKLALAASAVMLILFFIDYELGYKALDITGYSIKEMLMIIPPIFILLGLLDVWVPRQTMVKYMGEGSGITGVALSFFIGSAAAGPLYGAFPVAAVFMKKGVKFTNILIFLGAWSTTKIPMFLFEMSSLGPRFALTRLLVNIPGIIIMAMILSRIAPQKDIDAAYKKAETC